MKKLVILVLVTMVTYSAFSQSNDAPAQEDGLVPYQKVLIDFTKIAANYADLTLDYGADVRSALPQDEADRLPNLNYSLEAWRIVPNKSIRFPFVLDTNATKTVRVEAGRYEGEEVLGIRTYYPDFNFDMYVDVVPPFPPQLDLDPGNIFVEEEGYGVLTNVGVVKSAYLTIYGLYQQEKVYLLTEDSEGNVYEYPFGSLNFVGWRTLEWVNPQYIEKLELREISKAPLYPRSTDTRRFIGLRIQRSAVTGTQDFVSYVRDASLVYDRAVNEDLFTEFDDEATWRILTESSKRRNAILLRRITSDRFFEFLERRKKYDYDDALQDTTTVAPNNGQ